MISDFALFVFGVVALVWAVDALFGDRKEGDEKVTKSEQ